MLRNTQTDATGFNLDRILSNASGAANVFTFNPATCSAGSNYTAGSSDGRNLVVMFKDETMSTFEPMPAQKINFVPFAFEAKQIAGFTPASLVRVAESDGTLDTVSPLSNANYTELLAVIGGTSAQYTKMSSTAGSVVSTTAGNVATPSAGSVWLDTTAGNLKFYDGTVVKTLGTAGGSVTSVATGTGLTGGPITTTGTIALATVGAGGTGYKVTYDPYGRVTAAVALVEADIPTLSAAGKVVGSAITSGTIGGSTAMNTTGTISSGAITSSGLITSPYLSATAIGTQSLQVFETTNSFKVTIQAPASLGANYALTLPTNAGTTNQVLTTNGAGLLSWSTPAATGFMNGGNTFGANSSIGNNDNFDLTVKTNNLARMTVTAAGNVGIGTTAPTASLQVSGGNMLLDNNTSYQMKDDGGVARQVVTTAVDGSVFVNGYHGSSMLAGVSGATYYRVSGGPGTSIMALGANGLTINTAGATVPSAGVGLAVATGNVGIGTTAPTALLQLKASAGAAGSAPLKFTTGTLMATAEDGAMEYASSNLYYTIGTTRYIIPMNTAAGNYSNVSAIGNSSGSITMTPMAGSSVIVNSATVSTSATTGALIVNGGAGISGAVNASGNIVSGGSVTATTNMVSPQIYGSSAASGNIKIDGTSNATVGNVLLASAGGNVGIGTTAPTHPLNVESAIALDRYGGASPHLVLRGAGGTLGSPSATASGAGIGLVDGNNFDGSSWFGTAGVGFVTSEATTATNKGSEIYFTTTANGTAVTTERMRIANNGYVGIGTTAPTSKLSVSGGNVGIDNTNGYQVKDTSGTYRNLALIDAGNNVQYSPTTTTAGVYS